MKRAWVGILVMALFVGPACTDTAPEDDGSVENNPTGDGDGDDTGDDDPPPEVTHVQVSGWVGEWASGFPPIPDATVSLISHPEVEPVTSDEEGLYVFPSVPIGEELEVRIVGDETRVDAISRIFTMGQTDVEIGPMFLWDRGLVGFMGAVAGVEHDPSKAFVVGGVWRDTDEVLVGSTVSLSPESGQTYYTDEAGLPDPDLTAISPGAVFSTWNVEVGEYIVTAQHETTTRCYAPNGIQPEEIRLRTYADSITFTMGFVCGD